jgi:hypothetical protein
MAIPELSPEFMEPGWFAYDFEAETADLEEQGYLVYSHETTYPDGEPFFIVTILDKNGYRALSGQEKVPFPEIIPEIFLGHPFARVGFTAHEALQEAKKPWQTYLDYDAAA